ncbi:hypothetical protein D3OALGB2SA_3624 [Olavius algarvensis associated proteobacterium Delta 3]|nr:hypothetical protein D3OALGB2SA_3624 [Olavius algarvensis associated proteobacterium Delta 3]
MFRTVFIVTHVLLASHFARLGFAAYKPAHPAWDAGVIPIFCAFWFLFAALSFYLKNAWMVTMFTFAMGGTSSLYLLIGGITELSMYGRATEDGGATIPIVGAVFIFLMIGQIYAVYMDGKVKRDQGSG